MEQTLDLSGYWKKAALALGSVILMAALANCSSAAPPSMPEQTTTSAAEPATTGVVPAPLDTIEAGAEDDIIDKIPGGGWAAIQGEVTDMTDAWAEYEAQAVSDGAAQAQVDAMHSALEALAKAAQADDEIATEQTANDVSFAVVDLFALYHPAVPAAIGRLDAQERQVIIDVKANDLDAAGQELDRTFSTWDDAKPEVLAANGSEAAQAFEASLDAQMEAVAKQDARVVQNEAAAGLELVDDLERVF